MSRKTEDNTNNRVRLTLVDQAPPGKEGGDEWSGDLVAARRDLMARLAEARSAEYTDRQLARLREEHVALIAAGRDPHTGAIRPEFIDHLEAIDFAIATREAILRERVLGIQQALNTLSESAARRAADQENDGDVGSLPLAA
ncbi:MAG TPA: hypothetical protein VFY29_13245 [Terriglobia bacterium]|nr:hypothetical protein [Terriglobia bacterium]